MKHIILHLNNEVEKTQHIFVRANMVNGNVSVTIRRENDIAPTLIMEMLPDGHAVFYPKVLESFDFEVRVQGFERSR